MLAKFLIYLATVVGAIAFAALFIVIFGNSLEVQCARSTDGSSTCEISRALLGKYPLTSQTVTGIVDVKRDESCDAEDGCSYRTLLVTSSGQSVPLNDVYTDAAPVEKQMDSISAFLDGQTDSFDYAREILLENRAVLYEYGGLSLLISPIVYWRPEIITNKKGRTPVSPCILHPLIFPLPLIMLHRILH